MKIGIDIRALNSSKLTGVGNYVLNAVKTIVELDKKNEYYLFSSGLNNNVNQWLNFKRIDAKHIHLPISNKIINFSLTAKLGLSPLKFMPKDMDLFWLPNINFFRTNNKIPFIITIHDLSFLHSKEFYSLKRKIWHRMVDVNYLVEKAARVIAVSENTKRDMVRFFSVDKDKIQVINPGLDVTEMDDDLASQLIQKYHIKDKYFVYVGTIEPRKNIDSIIKAFDLYNKKYKDVDLIIIGGKGWVYEKIFKKIRKRLYIKYLDYIAGPKKDALYHLSQGLIWPSFYEGYGFPPLEATYHGIPVISSYKTSLPEIMKNQAIYVDPYNVSDIYHALLSLTEDKKLIHSLRKSAKDFVLPQWEKQAQEIINLFNTFEK